MKITGKIQSDEAKIRLAIPRVGQLIDSIESLAFYQVNAAVWNTILNEGLTEEQNEPRRAGWEMALLPVSLSEANDMRGYEDTAIELFNAFDIALKEHYAGQLIDLVDYDSGIVNIVRKAQKSLRPQTC
jgi:hypothetical protein